MDTVAPTRMLSSRQMSMWTFCFVATADVKIASCGFLLMNIPVLCASTTVEFPNSLLFLPCLQTQLPRDKYVLPSFKLRSLILMNTFYVGNWHSPDKYPACGYSSLAANVTL